MLPKRKTDGKTITLCKSSLIYEFFVEFKR